MQPKKIVMIGSGNVGSHLIKALSEAGHTILQIYSRTQSNADALANKVDAEAISEISHLTRDADLYLIAVKDSIVGALADKLHLKDKIVAHTSGVLEMEILEHSSSRIGVFYPLQSFSKGRRMNMQEAPFCIEGSDAKTTEALEDLARSISNKVHHMTSKERAVLHIAAVFTNNFVNHLLLQAKQISEAGNIPFDILQPLAIETIRKAFDTNPEEAQTGPAIRGDHITIEKHKALLKDNPEALKSYTYLTGLIIERYK